MVPCMADCINSVIAIFLMGIGCKATYICTDD
jgi:hypothetical protein